MQSVGGVLLLEGVGVAAVDRECGRGGVVGLLEVESLWVRMRPCKMKRLVGDDLHGSCGRLEEGLEFWW